MGENRISKVYVAQVLWCFKKLIAIIGGVRYNSTVLPNFMLLSNTTQNGLIKTFLL